MDTADQQPDRDESDDLASAEERETSQLIPADVSPQEFYARITKREDVRTILEQLGPE